MSIAFIVDLIFSSVFRSVQLLGHSPTESGHQLLSQVAPGLQRQGQLVNVSTIMTLVIVRGRVTATLNSIEVTSCVVMQFANDHYPGFDCSVVRWAGAGFLNAFMFFLIRK